MKCHRNYFILFFLPGLFSVVFLWNLQPVYGDDNIMWRTFPDPAFEVNGLPWFNENTPELFRLPLRIKDRVRPPVWNLAKSPSGGRIRFRSDCTTLAVRLQYPDLGRMKNMHTFGQSGLDLYVDGQYVKTAIPDKSTDVEYVYFENVQSRPREITIYLPLYKGVRVLAVGTNAGAEIAPAAPFVLEKPIAYYGTSITQGGCASRSGMAYQAIISRRLNMDYVNLGFSGNGRGEKEMAEVYASIDAACYVLDFAVNNKRADSLQAHYGPFLDILRQRRPTVPVIAVTPIYFTRNDPLIYDNRTNDEMRDVILHEVTKRIKAGDKNLVLVEGTELLGAALADGLVDGVHPNDLGFQIMADRLIPTLVRVLNLADTKTLMK